MGRFLGGGELSELRNMGRRRRRPRARHALPQRGRRNDWSTSVMSALMSSPSMMCVCVRVCVLVRDRRARDRRARGH